MRCACWPGSRGFRRWRRWWDSSSVRRRANLAGQLSSKRGPVEGAVHRRAATAVRRQSQDCRRRARQAAGRADAFYSVLLGMDVLSGDDRVLSRWLPGDPIIGEGKPENQNHAIIFNMGSTCRRST